MTWIVDWARRLFEPPGQPVTGHPRSADPELEVDAEGWLVGSTVTRVPSVRHSALTVAAGPLGIVWHYTATDVGTAASLARRIRTYKRGVDRAASWHVIVDSEGQLWQSVSFLRGAWHCAKGWIDGHRINACTVGIELEGYGKPNPMQGIAAERLMRALVEAYGIRQSAATLGHSDFDPQRRRDPGPLWRSDLRAMSERVFGRAPVGR